MRKIAKPKLLAINDQMERIMKLKQGDSSSDDFVKLPEKEIKVCYEMLTVVGITEMN